MTARHLIPMLVVVAFAVLGPALSGPDPCASTDGPQFRCWLTERTHG